MLERSEAPRLADGGEPSPFSASGSTPGPVRHRKVAILGFAETVKDAPFDDTSWELWAMNGFQRQITHVPEARYSLWFDMHTVDYIRWYGQASGTGEAQLQWLRQPHPFPILMQAASPEFPSALAFPLEQLVAKLGRDYFTSSVAFALAFALAQDDVAEVGLWGIDLVHGTEWGDQRPCAEYWIGRLEAAGVRLTVHEESALLKQRGRYGYESRNPLAKELRATLVDQAAGLERAIKQHQADIAAKTAQAHTDDGALQVVRAMIDRLDIWSRGGRV